MDTDTMLRALAPRLSALSAAGSAGDVRGERLFPRLRGDDPMPRLSAATELSTRPSAARPDGGDGDGDAPTRAEVDALRERVATLEAEVGDDPDPGSPF